MRYAISLINIILIMNEIEDEAVSENEEGDLVDDLARPSYLQLDRAITDVKERGSTIAKFTKDVFVSEV